MIPFNNDVVIPFSFSNKQTNQSVGVRGVYVSLNSIPTNLVQRFNNVLPTNTTLAKEVFLQASALGVLLASNFKFSGTFKLQLTCYSSPVKAILIDVAENGDVRGMFSVNKEHSFTNDISFLDMVGDGYLVFHINSNISTQPYQAVIDLQKDSLEKNAQVWFNQSEQILTNIKLFSNPTTNQAGALFIQIVPNASANNEQKNQDLDDFNTLAVLSNSMQSQEFFNAPAEDILFRLFNEYNIITHSPKHYQYNCSCSSGKVAEVLKQLGEKNNTKVECNFCGKVYN